MEELLNKLSTDELDLILNIPSQDLELINGSGLRPLGSGLSPLGSGHSELPRQPLLDTAIGLAIIGSIIGIPNLMKALKKSEKKGGILSPSQVKGMGTLKLVDYSKGINPDVRDTIIGMIATAGLASIPFIINAIKKSKKKK